jgi:hypothetical protein
MIKEAIEKLGYNKFYSSILCKVQSVNKDLNSCEVAPLNGDADLLSVRLNSVGDGNAKIVFYPSVDSLVFVTLINDFQAFVSCFPTEVEEIKIECEKVVFNGGDLGGLIKIEELKSELDKINQILQAFLNTLQTPINEPGNGAPSAFQSALNAVLSGKQLPTYNDIEDQKIKH